MEFLTPMLFGGLALVSAPVIIHLLHRRQVRPVEWAAMRFLEEMLIRQRRRLRINEWLLLLVRAAIIAAIVFAMVRPALRPPGAAAAGAGAGLRRSGRTAVVLLLDDSLTTQSGRSESAFDALKRLAVAYLATLAPGDEVSVIPLSRAAEPADDPVYDLEAVRAAVLATPPAWVAGDIPALLDAGLARLRRHTNPGAELVLVTDGRRAGWRLAEVARWEELRRRLRGPATAAPGTRGHPRLLVLAAEPDPAPRNLTVAAFAPDRSWLTAGAPVGLVATLRAEGGDTPTPAHVELLVDGRAAGRQDVTVPAGGEVTATFTHTFALPGSYSVAARLAGAADYLAADDSRSLAVTVGRGLSVLLIDGPERAGLRAKLGFLRYALDPEGKGAGPFQLNHVSRAQFVPSLLADARVVVLGDAAGLDPATVAALERFVVGGGGLLAGLGPDTRPAVVNREWFRGGEGFFPAALGAATTPARAPRPAGLDRAHPALAGLGDLGGEAWQNAHLPTYFTLLPEAKPDPDLEILLRLDNGAPLLVERRRGLGLVALLTTTLNAEWNDLPLQPAYVPLVRSVVGQLGSFVTPPRNLRPGEPLIYCPTGAAGGAVTATDPAGRLLPLTPGGWEGRDAFLSAPLREPGVYTVQDGASPGPRRFAVAPAPGAERLAPLTDRDLASVLEPGTPVFRRPGEVTAGLAAARGSGRELWPVLLALAIGLLFLETWLTRRAAGPVPLGSPAP